VRESRTRGVAYVQSGLSALTGLLAVMTVFWRDWIEALIGFNLDRHSGSLEWLVVAGLAVVSVSLGAAARRSWRQLGSLAPKRPR
jgi:hypothetical protein